MSMLSPYLEAVEVERGRLAPIDPDVKELLQALGLSTDDEILVAGFQYFSKEGTPGWSVDWSAWEKEDAPRW